MIERLDTETGRILKALENQGMTDNTLIIFTSDNGGAKFPGINLPLRGEKQLLLGDGIRVPMIPRLPGALPAGKTCSTPVIAMDITATIAATGGAKCREVQPFDGIDMIPILTGKAEPDANRSLFFRRRNIDVAQGQNQIQQTAIRHGDWKLLTTYKPSANPTCQRTLYHIKEGIGEANNLIAEKPEKAKELDELPG